MNSFKFHKTVKNLDGKVARKFELSFHNNNGIKKQSAYMQH